MEKSRTNKTAVAYALSVVLALALFLIGLVLKLCDIIDLSWWWITAPLWATFMFFLIAVGFLGLCLMILSYAAKRRK